MRRKREREEREPSKRKEKYKRFREFRNHAVRTLLLPSPSLQQPPPPPPSLFLVSNVNRECVSARFRGKGSEFTGEEDLRKKKEKSKESRLVVRSVNEIVRDVPFEDW